MPQRDSSRGATKRYPRTARVDKVLQAVVAEALERYDDDRLSLLTVTGLHVDPDLRHAVVFYATRNDTDNAEVEEAFGPVFGLPTSILVARDGSVCKRHFGPLSKEQLEKELKGLL